MYGHRTSMLYTQKKHDMYTKTCIHIHVVAHLTLYHEKQKQKSKAPQKKQNCTDQSIN